MGNNDSLADIRPRFANRIAALVICVVSVCGFVQGAHGLPVGFLVHFEGSVEVVSDGERVTADSLFIGAIIQDYDVIITGPEGTAEVELSVGPQGTILRVAPDSSCYVSSAVEPSGSRTEVRMLAGRAGFSVTPGRESQRFSVRTNTAVLGVRGTEFDVLNSPDEATLVGIREGSVAVEGGGTEVTAGQGSIVETVTGRAPQRASVPGGEYERYYQRWQEIRMEIFRSGASTFVRAYAQRFQDLEPDFQDAYQSLMEQAPALEQALNQEGTAAGDVQLRMQLGPAVVKARSVLPMFEMTVYRLRELQRYHARGIGRTQIGREPSTAFFRTFDQRERALLIQLSEMRTVLRDYARLQQRGFGAGFPNIPSPFDTAPSGPDMSR